jgi:tetratricopeptide (TPR) repeat protein
MPRARVWIAGGMAALGLCFGAAAEPSPPELGAMFASGEYLAAAQQAEAASSADNLAFAARSLLAQCMTGDREPEIGMVERAAADARRALALDPMHEEGRLQLAIALSLKSRSMTLMDAWYAGYGEEGRKLAEEVLAMDPGNFYAHGFLAVWNIEVRRRGGVLGASLLSASVEAGRKHYAIAAHLAPDDAGVHWQFARALAALDAVRYGDEAAAILDRAVAASSQDHVQIVMKTRAGRLAEALRGDRKAAQVLARTLL